MLHSKRGHRLEAAERLLLSPDFHSTNLFFNNVDIRHLVIVPQFADDTYMTDPTQAMKRYCATNQNGAMFNNFTAIDRQTELTDDDGSADRLREDHFGQ